MEEEKPRIISTNYAIERGVMVWKFTNNEVFVFAGALLVGFFTGYKLVHWGWPLMSSIVVAAFIPALTTLILLKLVVGKPRLYFADWIEWKIIKISRMPLVNIKKLKITDHEY